MFTPSHMNGQTNWFIEYLCYHKKKPKQYFMTDFHIKILHQKMNDILLGQTDFCFYWSLLTVWPCASNLGWEDTTQFPLPYNFQSLYGCEWAPTLKGHHTLTERETRMTTFIKTKFKILDDQTNIDKYRLATNITVYHIISKLILQRIIITNLCGPVSHLK